VPDRVGLPDVDRGALHGAARRGVDDRDAQDQRHARAVSDDVRANPVQRDVERPDLLFRRQGARRRGDGLLDGGAEQLRTAEEHGARASRVASCTQRARRRRERSGLDAPTSQPHTRLPQSRLRMGPKLDSAVPRTSAALSGYAYAYPSAWRFS
jgi:hypothetical protein